MYWKKKLLFPDPKQDSFWGWLSQKRKNAGKLSRAVQEQKNKYILSLDKRTGKVTDCGYDNIVCLFTKLPANRDFIFEADIEINCFLREYGATNQEAFGIFIRDTMDKDSETGLYYSNMIAVGGYYGRWNVYGRYGLSAQNIEHVSNILLYKKTDYEKGEPITDPFHYQINKNSPRHFHLKLIRKDDLITAVMIDEHGRDMLSPENNGGAEELAANNRIVFDCGKYNINFPKDIFCSRQKKYLYIGFLVAAGTEMTIYKESVKITILSKNHRTQITSPVSNELFFEDNFQAPVMDWDLEDTENRQTYWYASPNGSPYGDGSLESPLDLISAISDCGDGETVFLLPGTYEIKRDIIINKEHSGKRGSRRHLCSSEEYEQHAIIDFCGAGHALRICGDFWDVDNIRVTNGLGIIIEGSYNRVRKCSSFRNMETGILIRHHDNESARSLWPSYNEVTDCVSYENRDINEFNADGFACKVASGKGNVFRRCISWLNADDGFDLFSKNRQIGPVRIENCESYLNGYKIDKDGKLIAAEGSGNGYKLGGSGIAVEHKITDCISEGNRQCGFTNNSNPYLFMERCHSMNNGSGNICYYTYSGNHGNRLRHIEGCESDNSEEFDPAALLRKLSETYEEKL